MKRTILKILILCTVLVFALCIVTACDNSGENLQDDNHNHSYTAVITDPTCTDKGKTTYTCECGDSYTEEIEELGHNYVPEITAPTCTEQGYTTYICSRCQDNYVGDYTNALNHDFGEWIETLAPTCTNNGYTLHKCVCGDEYRTDETPAITMNRYVHSLMETKQKMMNPRGGFIYPEREGYRCPLPYDLRWLHKGRS